MWGGFNQGFNNLGFSHHHQPCGTGMSISVGGFGFNRWANHGCNYQAMNGFNYVDYSGGWNPMFHDQMLRNNIDLVFQIYDRNYSGQLEMNEFFNAYRDLCLRMGICPPMDFNSFMNAARQADTNFDGRISKMEMFMMFKHIQAINSTNSWMM